MNIYASTKERKIHLFLQCDGKCEYCGDAMVLTFSEVDKYEKSATFDHLYNRDHELRGSPNPNRERRIFLVCRKCNNDKSKEEPNNNLVNGVDKTIKKIVPKEHWSDEKYIDRITKVLAEEVEISQNISRIDKDFRRLSHEKKKYELALSKKVKYRNLLLQFRHKQDADFEVVQPKQIENEM